MKVLIWEAYALDVWRKLSEGGNIGEISVKICMKKISTQAGVQVAGWGLAKKV